MLESTRIQTEIPGPKSRALMERRHNAVSSGVGIATPMVAKEAKGALLTDVDGNTFIDFGGGIGVMLVAYMLRKAFGPPQRDPSEVIRESETRRESETTS